MLAIQFYFSNANNRMFCRDVCNYLLCFPCRLRRCVHPLVNCQTSIFWCLAFFFPTCNGIQWYVPAFQLCVAANFVYCAVCLLQLCVPANGFIPCCVPANFVSYAVCLLKVNVLFDRKFHKYNFSLLTIWHFFQTSRCSKKKVVRVKI